MNLLSRALRPFENRDVCAILQESVLILGRLGKQRLENRRASLGNLSSG